MPKNRAEKLTARSIADAQRITYMQAQEVMRFTGKRVLVGEEDGVKAYLSVLDNYYPYKTVDAPVYSSIVLPDGREVLAYEYGAQGTFTFSDGEERTGWVWPCDSNEKVVSEWMTSKQYDLLDRLDKLAYTFFSSEIEEAGHDYETMTLPELYKMVETAKL